MPVTARNVLYKMCFPGTSSLFIQFSANHNYFEPFSHPGLVADALVNGSAATDSMCLCGL